MDWNVVISIITGLAATIPLVIKLVEYVQKAVKEKNWNKLLELVLSLMEQAEQKFEDGATRKEWVLAMVIASADTINYDVDIDAVAELIDSLVAMSKQVNTPIPFKVGDTLQITDSDLLPDKLVTITDIDDGVITVSEELYDEGGVVITKVQYPYDVKMGVVNLMQWELNNRDKVGVASETISRHSVTYFDMNGDNSLMGYPKSLLGFLKPYMKARFGRGIRV